MGARRLKIVAGPHRGGELLLPESGELSIGSDDACDLVFSDPALAGRHALLRLEGGQARLIPQEGAVLAGEAALPDEGEEAADFRVYRLGETGLCLGPDQGPWPALDGEGRAPAEETETPEAAPEAPRLEMPRPDPGLLSRPRRAVLAAMCLSLSLAGLAWLLWSGDDESWADFQARLAEAGYAGLTLEQGPEGEMVLKGWLDTEQQAARLKEMARALRPDAVVEVGTVRSLAAGLNARARALGYPLLFIPEQGGRLRVRGYARNAEAAAGMRRALEPELGPFAEGDWEMKTWADLAATLPALASTRRLHFLRFEPRETSVAVTGLQNAPPEAWAAFQEEVRDMLGLPLVFVQAQEAEREKTPPPAAPPLPPERPALPAGAPCLGLARDPANRKGLRYADNGTGYLEGAVLPGGQRVVSVQPQGVFLEREGLMHFCPW